VTNVKIRSCELRHTISEYPLTFVRGKVAVRDKTLRGYHMDICHTANVVTISKAEEFITLSVRGSHRVVRLYYY